MNERHLRSSEVGESGRGRLGEGGRDGHQMSQISPPPPSPCHGRTSQTGISETLYQGDDALSTKHVMLRDRSLITGREGLQNGKIAVWNFLRPPQDKVKLFAPFRFKEWKLFAPPLVWLKRQVPVLKLAQNLFVTPPPPNIAWLKLPPPFFFVGVKLQLLPPPFP